MYIRNVRNRFVLLESGQTAQTFIEHAQRIHAFVNRKIWGEFRDPLPELPHRANPVHATLVVERHREMNDRLKEPFTRRLFRVPDLFQNVVTGVKLASVEQGNTPL